MFLGHFGSGKTEVAIGYSLKLAAEGQRPLLLDLDVITPYFRSRDPRDRLGELGVEVIAPDPEWSAADLPVIASAALMHLRMGGDRPAILDLGGDEGAKLMSSLKGLLAKDDYHVLVVVNPYRPSTRTAEQIVHMVRWLESISSTRVQGLVNNANLGASTTVETVLSGLRVVQEAASQLGIPVAFTACRADLQDQVRAAGVDALPLRIFMRPPWEELP